jgi:hypothetical protein
MAMELNGRAINGVDYKQDADQQPAQDSLSEASRAKTAKILRACDQKDTETLRLLAISEAGLISDELRCQACQCFAPYPLGSLSDTGI